MGSIQSSPTTPSLNTETTLAYILSSSSNDVLYLWLNGEQFQANRSDIKQNFIIHPSPATRSLIPHFKLNNPILQKNIYVTMPEQQLANLLSSYEGSIFTRVNCDLSCSRRICSSISALNFNNQPNVLGEITNNFSNSKFVSGIKSVAQIPNSITKNKHSTQNSISSSPLVRSISTTYIPQLNNNLGVNCISNNITPTKQNEQYTKYGETPSMAIQENNFLKASPLIFGESSKSYQNTYGISNPTTNNLFDNHLNTLPISSSKNNLFEQSTSQYPDESIYKQPTTNYSFPSNIIEPTQMQVKNQINPLFTDVQSIPLYPSSTFRIPLSQIDPLQQSSLRVDNHKSNYNIHKPSEKNFSDQNKIQSNNQVSSLPLKVALTLQAPEIEPISKYTMTPFNCTDYRLTTHLAESTTPLKINYAVSNVDSKSPIWEPTNLKNRINQIPISNSRMLNDSLSPVLGETQQDVTQKNRSNSCISHLTPIAPYESYFKQSSNGIDKAETTQNKNQGEDSIQSSLKKIINYDTKPKAMNRNQSCNVLPIKSPYILQDNSISYDKSQGLSRISSIPCLSSTTNFGQITGFEDQNKSTSNICLGQTQQQKYISINPNFIPSYMQVSGLPGYSNMLGNAFPSQLLGSTIQNETQNSGYSLLNQGLQVSVPAERSSFMMERQGNFSARQSQKKESATVDKSNKDQISEIIQSTVKKEIDRMNEVSSQSVRNEFVKNNIKLKEFIQREDEKQHAQALSNSQMLQMKLNEISNSLRKDNDSKIQRSISVGNISIVNKLIGNYQETRDAGPPNRHAFSYMQEHQNQSNRSSQQNSIQIPNSQTPQKLINTDTKQKKMDEIERINKLAGGNAPIELVLNEELEGIRQQAKGGQQQQVSLNRNKSDSDLEIISNLHLLDPQGEYANFEQSQKRIYDQEQRIIEQQQIIQKQQQIILQQQLLQERIQSQQSQQSSKQVNQSYLSQSKQQSQQQSSQRDGFSQNDSVNSNYQDQQKDSRQNSCTYTYSHINSGHPQNSNYGCANNEFVESANPNNYNSRNTISNSISQLSGTPITSYRIYSPQQIELQKLAVSPSSSSRIMPSQNQLRSVNETSCENLESARTNSFANQQFVQPQYEQMPPQYIQQLVPMYNQHNERLNQYNQIPQIQQKRSSQQNYKNNNPCQQIQYQNYSRQVNPSNGCIAPTQSIEDYQEKQNFSPEQQMLNEQEDYSDIQEDSFEQEQEQLNIYSPQGYLPNQSENEQFMQSQQGFPSNQYREGQQVFRNGNGDNQINERDDFNYPHNQNYQQYQQQNDGHQFIKQEEYYEGSHNQQEGNEDYYDDLNSESNSQNISEPEEFEDQNIPHDEQIEMQNYDYQCQAQMNQNHFGNPIQKYQTMNQGQYSDRNYQNPGEEMLSNDGYYDNQFSQGEEDEDFANEQEEEQQNIQQYKTKIESNLSSVKKKKIGLYNQKIHIEADAHFRLQSDSRSAGNGQKKQMIKQIPPLLDFGKIENDQFVQPDSSKIESQKYPSSGNNNVMLLEELQVPQQEFQEKEIIQQKKFNTYGNPLSKQQDTQNISVNSLIQIMKKNNQVQGNNPHANQTSNSATTAHVRSPHCNSLQFPSNGAQSLQQNLNNLKSNENEAIPSVRVYEQEVCGGSTTRVDDGEESQRSNRTKDSVKHTSQRFLWEDKSQTKNAQVESASNKVARRQFNKSARYHNTGNESQRSQKSQNLEGFEEERKNEQRTSMNGFVEELNEIMGRSARGLLDLSQKIQQSNNSFLLDRSNLQEKSFYQGNNKSNGDILTEEIAICNNSANNIIEGKEIEQATPNTGRQNSILKEVFEIEQTRLAEYIISHRSNQDNLEPVCVSESNDKIEIQNSALKIPPPISFKVESKKQSKKEGKEGIFSTVCQNRESEIVKELIGDSLCLVEQKNSSSDQDNDQIQKKDIKNEDFISVNQINPSQEGEQQVCTQSGRKNEILEERRKQKQKNDSNSVKQQGQAQLDSSRQSKTETKDILDSQRQETKQTPRQNSQRDSNQTDAEESLQSTKINKNSSIKQENESILRVKKNKNISIGEQVFPSLSSKDESSPLYHNRNKSMMVLKVKRNELTIDSSPEIRQNLSSNDIRDTPSFSGYGSSRSKGRFFKSSRRDHLVSFVDYKKSMKKGNGDK